MHRPIRLSRATSPHPAPPLTAWLMLRRARQVPAFWRLAWISTPQAPQQQSIAPQKAKPEHAMLVLHALAVPVRAVSGKDGVRLYVPPLYTRKAERELGAFEAEQKAPLPPAPASHMYNNTALMLAFLAFMALWFAFISGSLPLGAAVLPDYAEWVARGKLDIGAIRFDGQWFRLVTALGLHADSAHLVANLVLGGPFIVLLGRSMGFGPALCVMLASGTLGNAFSLIYRPGYFTSLGFSTCLFGVIGALAALEAARRYQSRKNLFLPLAAGLAFLAMFGTEGAQTDVGAHASGLLAGMLVGGFMALVWPLRPPLWVRALCAGVAMGIIGWAWRLALASPLL